MQGSTYAEARRALENDETSCKALVSSFLDRIELKNPELNAFLRVDDEAALERAGSLDKERSKGEYRALTGMVVGVKDVLCRKGHLVTCGSKMLSNFKSLYTATAIDRLEEAGAVVIGATNCDEFAMGSSNELSHFGPVANPHDLSRVPGGSSGGSAAAVASGLCHVALGTDTGGSIRQPAAFCGVVGLKPTYGRVSRYGLVAYASSFDCIGPLANSVNDASRVLAAISGVDSRDATSLDAEPLVGHSLELGGVSGLRVGLPKEYLGEGLNDRIRNGVARTADQLRSLGADVVDVSLPMTEYGIAAYYVLVTAEASSNLARYDGVRYGFREEASSLREMYEGSRSGGFGEEVKRRIMLGTYVLSSGYYEAYYERAQRVRRLIQKDFDRVFSDVDMLLTPTTPTTAFKLGEKIDDPLQMYLNDVYTVTANLAGIPAISVPIQTDSNDLPMGVQMLAPAFGEDLLLRVGAAIESTVTG